MINRKDLRYFIIRRQLSNSTFFLRVLTFLFNMDVEGNALRE